LTGKGKANLIPKSTKIPKHQIPNSTLKIPNNMRNPKKIKSQIPAIEVSRNQSISPNIGIWDLIFGI
jgi:hypothetical protein